MPKRTTMLAILAGVIAAVVIFWLVSRTRTPAAPASTAASNSVESGGQRTDESRAASIVGAGLGAAGDIVGALA